MYNAWSEGISRRVYRRPRRADFFRDNDVACQASAMSDERTERARTHQGVTSFDQEVINRARVAAAGDPSLRLLLSEVWWVALRVGLAMAPERPLTPPRDPFSWGGLVADGLVDNPF